MKNLIVIVIFRCSFCDSFLSPNKFIFHSHRLPSVSYVQPDSPNFNAWRRHLRLHNPTQSEELRDAWEDVKAMFNGGNRKRSASATNSSLNNMNKLSSMKKSRIVEEEEEDEEEGEGEGEDDSKDAVEEENHEEKKNDGIERDEEHEEDENKNDSPIPPPAKIARIRPKEKRLPTHNVVSSTTTDEQLPDMNMFLPLTLPPLPSTTASTPFFPFPPPLPSVSNSLSFVTMNSTDWFQFFRSPLFMPNAFRSPFPALSRRFPFDFNPHPASIIGSGTQSAFKPPSQKDD